MPPPTPFIDADELGGGWPRELVQRARGGAPSGRGRGGSERHRAQSSRLPRCLAASLPRCLAASLMASLPQRSIPNRMPNPRVLLRTTNKTKASSASGGTAPQGACVFHPRECSPPPLRGVIGIIKSIILKRRVSDAAFLDAQARAASDAADSSHVQEERPRNRPPSHEI